MRAKAESHGDCQSEEGQYVFNNEFADFCVGFEYLSLAWAQNDMTPPHYI
jgi:hypothetical protein